MTGSVPFRGWAATLFVLAILSATHISIPSTAQATSRDQLGDSGGGGGRGYIIPGHGDDDQPTIVTPTPRRTTVQMTEPDGQGSGTVTTVRSASLNPVRRFFVRSRALLRGLLGFVP
jgi:hypothetical protein